MTIYIPFHCGGNYDSAAQFSQLNMKNREETTGLTLQQYRTQRQIRKYWRRLRCEMVFIS